MEGKNMPRQRKEPHLILVRARKDKRTGKITHRATWVIRDADAQTRTGCGKDERQKAELKLHEYNVEKYRQKALNLARKQTKGTSLPFPLGISRSPQP
jgi:hypothetical protein